MLHRPFDMAVNDVEHAMCAMGMADDGVLNSAAMCKWMLNGIFVR